MAYLDRQLSEYKTLPPLINRAVDNVKNHEQTGSKPAEGAKNSNHQLAKNLVAAKVDLIEAIVQFPITALWLINKYEQPISAAEQDDHDNSPSDLAVSVVDIKRNFLEYFQSFQLDNTSSVVTVSCKQRLIFQLQLFSFSFDDLIEVADLIIYCLIKSDLLPHRLNASANTIEKRLKTLSSSRVDALEKFRLASFTDYQKSFLLLPATDLPNHLTQLVSAEQRWLKTRQSLVMANNKLVLFIVNQYRGSFLDFNDLVQEGQTGLLKAVDRFDYRLGFQFSTYAGYWIRQAISRSLSRSERSVRIPCEQIANINRVFRAKDKLTTQTGREATVQEIAAYTQLSCDVINNILAIAQNAIPLEGGEDEDSEKAFAPVDFLEQQTFNPAIEEIAESELEALIADAIKTLNPREAQVVCCHFGVHFSGEMTLQEIGAELNLTRERIRQIQVIALNKIKLNYGQQLSYFL